MNIDWSKAPEGFPLWLEGTNEEHRKHSGWYRKSGLVYEGSHGGQWRGCREDQFFTVHRKPELVEWSGEGLPPVGAVCEYRCGYVEQPYSYAECTVIAHFVGESGKLLAAFAYVAHDGVVQLGRGMAELFRPIRTPEQIAAEDRDKAIEGMIADTNILTGIMSDRRIMAGQLYDAGYRKQVES